MARMDRVGLAFFVVVQAGCGSSSTLGCKETSDCAGGSVCYDRVCTPVCTSIDDCERGKCCTGGVCGSCGAEPAPVITSVNATGSPDPDPQSTGSHLTDRLRVAGSGLAQATFRLKSADNPSGVVLEHCQAATDAEALVRLPNDTMPGQYSLAAANQAGQQCSVEIFLMKGDTGSIDASAAQIVQSINSATAADPNVRVNGTLAGGMVSTLAARGSGVQVADRSIVVNGIERVTNTDPGLWVVVLDLASHQITASRGFLSDGSTTGQQLQTSIAGSELVTLLNTLSDTDVLIAASGGDLSALAAVSGVANALAAFGATQELSRVGANEGYVLVGSRGLVQGSALEQLADAERSGVAQVTTVAVDGVVVGFFDRESLITLKNELVAQGAPASTTSVAGAVHVTPAGNVGIGTSQPTSLFEVKGRSYQLTGTVTGAAGNGSLIGGSTLFATELRAGETVLIGSTVYTVQSIAGETSMTVSPAPAAGFIDLPFYRVGAFFSVRTSTNAPALEVSPQGVVSVGTAGMRVGGDLTVDGDLNFTKANPSINASSFFVAPGGAYFNGGSVYTEATIAARGGIGNDTGPSFYLHGGQDASKTTIAVGRICVANNCSDYLTHDGTFLVVEGELRVSGGVFSPGFFDSNDVTYYVDPAGSSRLNEVVAGRVYGLADIRTPLLYDQNNTAYYVDPNVSSRMNEVVADRVYGLADIRTPLLYDQNNTAYYLDPNVSSRLNEVVADRVYGLADIRTPILYDQNNTGYYVDPASTSNLNALSVSSVSAGDVSCSGCISASEINRTGLDADSVDGRQPGPLVYSCPASCAAPTSWCNSICTATSTISLTPSTLCHGQQAENTNGNCVGTAFSTCACSFIGYLMN